MEAAGDRGVVGNQIYDTRLVAAMTVHAVGRILTFNAADFARYGIIVLHPSTVCYRRPALNYLCPRRIERDLHASVLILR
jgi:hypothetical protein